MLRLRESRLASFLAPADADLVRAGAGGESLIARARLIFFGVLMLIPVVARLTAQEVRPEYQIGMVGGFVALLVATLIAWVAHRRGRIRGLALATTTLDVSLVTGLLVAFAVWGRPIVAVNSLAVWPLYLLFIFATSLRFDVRVTLFAGALSLAQSLAVVLWVSGVWDLSSPDSQYGVLSWPIQIARVIMIIAATGLTIGIVRRSRRFIFVAGTDNLTGLWNRAYFDLRLSSELARARRRGNVLSIAFVDVDRFKQVNDTWGHNAGDSILQTVARVLESESRREDIVVRWGGDEFVLILANTDVAGALEQMERVRAGLAGASTPVPGREFRMTVSVGLAEFPRDGEAAEILVATADHRLFVAKRSGRDRVVAEGSPPRGAA